MVTEIACPDEMEEGVTAKLVIIGPELSAVVETFTVFENCIPLFTKSILIV